MSFDLFLTPRSGGAIDRDAVRRWTESIGEFSVVSDGDYSYENAATGVYFMLHATAESVAVHVNYYRPSFFGNEAFEVLETLCGEVPLLASDPQGRGEPEEYDRDALIASYTGANARSHAAFTEMGGEAKPRMPRANSLALWRYRRIKDALAGELSEAYGEDYMVPDLMVVSIAGGAPAGAAHAYRLAFIPKPTYYVLPPADLFAFRRGEQTLITRAERILPRLADFFVPLDDYPEFSRSTESALFDNMDEWDAILDGAPVDHEPSAVTRVALDGFIDE